MMHHAINILHKAIIIALIMLADFFFKKLYPIRQHVHLFCYTYIMIHALCMMQYASCIMHECIMCNKIINALSKIYFALKKDTPQGYNANNLFLHNAFAYACTHAHFMMHAWN